MQQINRTTAAGPVTIFRPNPAGELVAVETLESPGESGQHAGPGCWNNSLKPGKRGPKPGAKKTAAEAYSERAQAAARDRDPYEGDDE